MFVHITVFFVYFINKSGEEDPENSPAVVFVSPFSVCVGFCVWFVGFLSSPPSISLSCVFSPLWKPSKWHYIDFGDGEQGDKWNQKLCHGLDSFLWWHLATSSNLCRGFHLWEVARMQRKEERDVPSWGKMLPGVGRTLIIHFHGSARVPCCW